MYKVRKQLIGALSQELAEEPEIQKLRGRSLNL